MNPTIATIQSIIQKCMRHQEMCFMERPLLYRQTNDYEQQEKIRKNAYNKHYLYHLHNYIILYNKVKQFCYNQNLQIKIYVIKITNKYNNINDHLHNKICKYLYHDSNTFEYEIFSKKLENDNYLYNFMNYKTTKNKLALMILNQYYNKENPEKNNNFIKEMRKFDKVKRVNAYEMGINIRSLIVWYNLDYQDQHVNIPQLVDSMILFS